MQDIIRLLPDNIANQIAAGEVIQRPASAIKELIENAVDAKAKLIKVVLTDAGKTLIQVSDDGIGMSENDAKMCFERHATSKITSSEDLFNILTKGFRGEALASIAAIAQVELKTKKKEDTLGTLLKVEGSKTMEQSPISTTDGTTFSIKNLFFNVPARRNFLKSDTTELGHILDEFLRVALAHPDIRFELNHNSKQLFTLPASTHRQRIVGILGQKTNDRLVPVNEKTEVITISGFVGKPEFAKRKKGEQFFFVNNRFIKSGYLHHAILSAYEGLIQKEVTPLYVLYLEIDPSKIDINVHPTKQEIKFDDEKLIYNYLKVAVKHALGSHQVTPTLDFDTEVNFLRVKKERPTQFSSSSSKTPNTLFDSEQKRQKDNLQNWQSLYDRGGDTDSFTLDTDDEPENTGAVTLQSKMRDHEEEATLGFETKDRKPYQLHQSYIISPIKSGFLLIDQQAASERIVYEKNLAFISNKNANAQRLLFPVTIHLSRKDAETLESILEEIQHLGFEIQLFGKDSFVIHALPTGLENANPEELVETLISQYQMNVDIKLNREERLSKAMARSASLKRHKSLDENEMNSLIDELFACSQPYFSPFGKKTFINYESEEIDRLLLKK